MREYIDLVNKLVESILAELETVPVPDNTSKEIGASGKSVDNHMNDMLPHNAIPERNNPRSFADIYHDVVGKTYNTSHERETPPPSATLKKRRNNDASVKKFKPVPDKGDASATLHSDFANGRPNTRSVVPLNVRKKSERPD